MKYSLRNFFIIFIISVVIFTAAAFYAVKFVQNYLADTLGNMPKPGETQTETGIPGTDPVITETGGDNPITNNGTFCVLLAGIDGRTGFADAMMLARFDKTQKTVMYTSISKDTRLFIDGSYKKLGDVYASRGGKFICGKVSAITGIKVDNYVAITEDGFADIIDAIGGISYYVPQDMHYEAPDIDLVIDLKKGQQKLSGQTALDMLRFRIYPNGDLGRCELQRKFVKAFCESFLTPSNISRLPEIITILYESITTEFTAESLIGNSEIVFSFGEYASTELVYPGEVMNEDGDTFFIPDIDAALQLYRNYK
ncbi:MAG: LCP family protein [Oscillospiraceae bacterium]|nr:LCP family protein [Oscillospiraceae bacterium]